MKTKAAILVELKKPLVVDEVEVPKLSFGQVLVKLEIAGVCGKQIDEFLGTRGNDPYLPHLLGHEGAGIVEEIGAGVTRVKAGDHVLASWLKGSGINAPTPIYNWNGKNVNAGNITTFQRYSVLSENRLTKIPDELPFAAAALLGCAVPTGMGTVLNQAKARPGETIAIFGAGGIGLCAIMAAALISAHKIIVIDIVDEKLKRAAKFGATDIINSSQMDPVTAIRDLTNGEGVDHAICTVGNPVAMEQAYNCASRTHGYVVLAGVTGEKICLDPYPMNFGRQIAGSHGGETIRDRDIPKYINLYQSGKLKIEELITDRFKLEDINQIFAAMKNGKISGRAVIEF